MKKRLDLILVEREFFETREKAKREIMAGNVIVNEQVVIKAGTMFKDNDELNIRVKDKLKYVSRGGLKLEKAIKAWDLDFSDKLVLDIGASTGGFTDCALQNGARRVYSVDVGKNQLDWKLRNDEKVVSLEEMHIKDLKEEDIENKKVDFIVIDVSFISLTKVIPYFKKFLAQSGKIVMLVKPQFEVGREKIGRNGVVENEEYHNEAIKKIISFSKEEGYELIGVEDSPIKGAKGNKEFLMLIKSN
ncbi:TlyA family RNA methyltransferase [Leptotrichia buccalis]|jgi:ftsJ-like methyltransferase|uniref:Hemolysin A n=1 Tax=Leptotrichia buccalis (strain ATCC 14201 / DSM 1135 / JCM 12969 / NCTC 10249 / C-1013-b) TaxID=523794 RepID=C7NE63_LEPBD|nr:TlyA family RNA methyltransferase [Leptotrichia buccalis]ACV38258.1 hemolysin A [Leptotrichia buccalis C-1013-b]